jgi:hypothetical protein
VGELRGKAKKEKFPKLLDLAEAKGGEREIPDLKALRGLPCEVYPATLRACHSRERRSWILSLGETS